MRVYLYEEDGVAVEVDLSEDLASFGKILPRFFVEVVFRLGFFYQEEIGGFKLSSI